jgi:hypothetical protein
MDLGLGAELVVIGLQQGVGHGGGRYRLGVLGRDPVLPVPGPVALLSR